MTDWDHFESSNSHPPDSVDPVIAGMADVNITEEGELSEASELAGFNHPPNQWTGPSGDFIRDVAARGWSDRIPFEYANLSNPEFAEWACNAKCYEWSDEFGDVGPKNEELEKQLFNADNMTRAGLQLDRLNEIDVKVESEDRVLPIVSWDHAGLHPIMRQNIDLCLYTTPTAIQMYTVPAILTDRDLIGISQTGSGKTAAYLIPILSKLMGKAKKLAAPRPDIVGPDFDAKLNGVRAEPLVLIVCPTRELATQIFDDARRLCYRSMLRPCVAYGGVPSRFQRDELHKGCDVLIGTPGRIIDFMGQGHVLSLNRVKYTVIDEADELLHSDWEDDFKRIMSDATEDDDHRYMMFSATFNRDCRKLAREYLSQNYVRISIGRPGSSHFNVEQQIIYVEETRKNDALYDLLLSMCPIRILVFVNSKKQVDFVDAFLYEHGLPSTSIHGDRTQREREDAIRSFKTAQCPIMVATALSARGLDIPNLMHVVNYDLPRTNHGGIDEYIHRIGRTARIGNEGLATSFYTDKDRDLAFDLVRILLECNQPVPDFLEEYIPAGSRPVFDDDDTDTESGDDENDAGVAGNLHENEDNLGEDRQGSSHQETSGSDNTGLVGSHWATADVTL
ncbi:hypothetical protein N7448_010657 [Penicillium atrosanguineum]|uniref:RNA helicase n=1 Tax=Penicillium atrosanguineum TaxID=1132637 RepID=A0A9W9TZC8_9EURO|nr:uncharacterized protein N7443_007880 [Penicillium atrosanguineum]KAJ5118951.1 hypothetical protein N7526_010588 [Penicillium atrosanguineum]KAJ5119988.1 hypothetical protein N7448_010657 [Penicillium atrosanguineum]KAJ5296987.1 hypothetical protein N7443_007880 [Penicillium atrosanguineum]KAJ5299747.1 hypothetical protein N7476_011304 [Penicillium atrosanguineum]